LWFWRLFSVLVNAVLARATAGFQEVVGFDSTQVSDVLATASDEVAPRSATTAPRPINAAATWRRVPEPGVRWW
jgi:hypothetical protein